MQKGVRALKGIYGIWEGEGGREGLQFMRYKLINQLVEEGREGSTKLKDNILKEQCKLMVLPVAGALGEFPVQTSCSFLCTGYLGERKRGTAKQKKKGCW